MQSIKKWLKELSKEYNIYLAGGGPLDLYLGREPKDLDVFIDGMCDKGDDPFKLCDQWFINKSKKFVLPDRWKTYSYGSDQKVYWTVLDGIQIDLIAIPPMDGVLELVQGFDFDICEIWVNGLETGKWDIQPTAKAKKAIKTKKIEYRTGPNINRHFNKNDHKKDIRIARYKEKFPEYEIWERL